MCESPELKWKIAYVKNNEREKAYTNVNLINRTAIYLPQGLRNPVFFNAPFAILTPGQCCNEAPHHDLPPDESESMTDGYVDVDQKLFNSYRRKAHPKLLRSDKRIKIHNTSLFKLYAGVNHGRNLLMM